jgi:hypothetical protein
MKRFRVETARLVKGQNTVRHSYDAAWPSLFQLNDHLSRAYTLPGELGESVGSGRIKHLTKPGDVQAIDAVALINHEQTNRKSHDLVQQTCALSMLLHLEPWTLDPGVATARR